MAFVRSETDLFSEPGYDVTLQTSGTVEYHPLSSVTDPTAPISFFIQGNDTHYIDFSETLLYLRCTMKHSDNSDVAAYTNAGDKSGPINNLLHSLIQNCSVMINETQITPTTSLYPFRAYLETLLAYGGDYVDTLGRAAMYVKDNDNATTTDGYSTRQNLVSGGKIFDLIGRPHVDMCSQNRYMIPGMDVRFTFHRTPPSFYTHQAAGAAHTLQLNILGARLIVKKHALLPSILIQHLRLWESGFPATYPMRKIEMKSYSLAVGTIQNTNENLLNGLLPDRLIVALSASNAVNGVSTASPFDFAHYGLTNITVSANGDQTYFRSIDVDFPNLKYGEAYHNMFNALGLSQSSDGPNINYEDFANGKALYVFNLRHSNDGFCLPRFGNVKIDLKFSTALTSALTVVCHADYQSVLFVDNQKNIYFKDYSNKK